MPTVKETEWARQTSGTAVPGASPPVSRDKALYRINLNFRQKCLPGELSKRVIAGRDLSGHCTLSRVEGPRGDLRQSKHLSYLPAKLFL